MAYNAFPLYLTDPSYHSSEMQEAMEAAHERWLHKHNLEERSILYHYTTLAGLRGILSSRALWYTHIYSLNDPAEIQYGLNIVRGVLDELIEEGEKLRQDIQDADFIEEGEEQRQDIRQDFRVELKSGQVCTLGRSSTRS